MIKSKLLAAIAVAVAAVAALSAPATASAAGNATVENAAGESAYTTFISRSGEGNCIETTVGIFATHEIIQHVPGKPDAVTRAFIRLAQSDKCTGTQLRQLIGSHELEKSSFQVSSRARTGNLTTTNFILENTQYPDERLAVNVDVAWSGTDDLGINRGTTQNFELGPDCRLTLQATGLFRNAPALGSVSDGETNFTPGPSQPYDGEGESESQIGSFRSAILNIGAGCL